MKSDITIEEARNLTADSRLWPLVRNFLWDFAPQIHPSWIAGLKIGNGENTGQALQDMLNPQSVAMSSCRLKQFVLSSLSVEPLFHNFPKDDWSRLVLLDCDALLEIAKWLGALTCADELRRVMDGATVRALKAALPGVYPEVFAYTAYFGAMEIDRRKFEHLDSQAVIIVGLNMLFSALPEIPSLAGRLKLKLPKAVVEQFSTLDLSTSKSKFPPSKLRLLLKLRFPEAYSLCC